MRSSSTGDRLIALFLLGLLLFSPALLAIFRSDALVFGIPVLFLYVFSAWIGLTALLALVLRGRDAATPGERPGDTR